MAARSSGIRYDSRAGVLDGSIPFVAYGGSADAFLVATDSASQRRVGHRPAQPTFRSRPKPMSTARPRAGSPSPRSKFRRSNVIATGAEARKLAAGNAGIPDARRRGRACRPRRRRARRHARLHQAAPAVRAADRQLPGAAASRGRRLHRYRAQPLARLSRARRLRRRRAPSGDGVGGQGARFARPHWRSRAPRCRCTAPSATPRSTISASTTSVRLRWRRATAASSATPAASPASRSNPRRAVAMTDLSSSELRLCAIDARGVATLTLNRPDKGNSYNGAMLDALLDELRAARRRSCRARHRAARRRQAFLRRRGDRGRTGRGYGEAARDHSIDLPRSSIRSPSRPSRSCTAPASAAPSRSSPAATSSSPREAPSSHCRRCGSALRRARSFRSFCGRSMRAACAAISFRASASRPRRRCASGSFISSAQPTPAMRRWPAVIDELLLAGPNAVAHAKSLLRRLTHAPISPELLDELQGEFDARFNSPEADEGRASFREKRKPRWYPKPT